MNPKHAYTDEPEDPQLFTERFDRFYSRFAHSYDWLVKTLPVWRNWLNHVIPHVQGERILEASFGTGYLLTQYAHDTWPDERGHIWGVRFRQCQQSLL